jgi:hypothetical protein
MTRAGRAHHRVALPFVGNPTDSRALGSRRGTGGGGDVAAITLAAARAFNILALAIQVEH